MFAPLTDRPVPKAPSTTLAAVLLHAGVLLALAISTTPDGVAAPAPDIDTMPVYLPDQPRTAAPAPAAPTHTGGPSIPTAPPSAPALPVAPIIPGLPAPDVEPGPVAWRPVVTIGVGPSRYSDPAPIDPSGPWTTETVDQPVRLLHHPAPVYPAALRAAGLAGLVEVEFVVDTAGRVEPDSWRVLSTSHDLFGLAARQALLRARFEPAMAGGRKVRQLVRQPLRFQLNGPGT